MEREQRARNNENIIRNLEDNIDDQINGGTANIDDLYNNAVNEPVQLIERIEPQERSLFEISIRNANRMSDQPINRGSVSVNQNVPQVNEFEPNHNGANLNISDSNVLFNDTVFRQSDADEEDTCCLCS